MQTEESIRLHTLCNLVGVDTPNTKQLYLTADDALALATELRRYAKGCKAKKWYAPRIIKSGKARNESNGKTKPYPFV